MKRILSRLTKIVSILILILSTLVIVGIVVCGYRPIIVLSGSMEPEIQTGSVAILDQKAKYENVEVGDIVSYKVNTGALVTHRVVHITECGMETKGDANDVSDGICVNRTNFKGKIVFSIPEIGYIFIHFTNVLEFIDETVAYLSDEMGVNYTVSVGGVNVEIVEEYIEPEKIEPGCSFVKDIKVRNLGPGECYVRIKADFHNGDVGKTCSVDWNTADFIYNEADGYFYYENLLSADELTPSLFTTVSVKEDIVSFNIKDYAIFVYSEAYQSGNFDDYKSAWEFYHKNEKKM